MKQFLKELKGEWRQLKYFPRYRYSWKNSGKYLTRSLLIRLNREFSAIIVHLVNNPTSILVLVGAIALSVLLPITVLRDDILGLLTTVSGFIISFISVLVAAAIFVSTLHRQSSNRSAEEDVKFIEVVTDNKGTLMKVYELCSSIASDDQRLKLFKATPCDSVMDQADYDNFKSWHSKNVQSLNGAKLEPYDNFVKYPYNAAMSVSWSRAYYMSEGCEIARILLEKKGNGNKALKNSVKELTVASKRNQASGSRSYHIPVEFVGQRLYRVVVYSLVALIFIFTSSLLSHYSSDIIVNTDVGMKMIFIYFAIGATTGSVYLILRYVFKFIAYLKDSTAYATSGFNNLYIYEPDVTMHDSSIPR